MSVPSRSIALIFAIFAVSIWPAMVAPSLAESNPPQTNFFRDFGTIVNAIQLNRRCRVLPPRRAWEFEWRFDRIRRSAGKSNAAQVNALVASADAVSRRAGCKRGVQKVVYNGFVRAKSLSDSIARVAYVPGQSDAPYVGRRLAWIRAMLAFERHCRLTLRTEILPAKRRAHAAQLFDHVLYRYGLAKGQAYRRRVLGLANRFSRELSRSRESRHCSPGVTRIALWYVTDLELIARTFAFARSGSPTAQGRADKSAD